MYFSFQPEKAYNDKDRGYMDCLLIIFQLSSYTLFHNCHMGEEKLVTILIISYYDLRIVF